VKAILAVPDSGPLAASLLHQIQEHGFDGARIDVDPDRHERNWAQVFSFSNYVTLFPIFLLAPGFMRRASGRAWTERELVAHTNDFCLKLKQCGFFDEKDEKPLCALEIGNEPDIAAEEWKDHPERMGETIAACFDVVRRYSSVTPVLSASISNLNERGIKYLGKMVKYLPIDCDIAFHRYPPGRDFNTPHKGASTRSAEVAKLRDIVGWRKLWNTETGWAEQNKGHILTEPEVADRIDAELRFWQAHGIEALTIYQLNSAHVQPGDNDDERRLKTYGMRRPDDSWKPAALAVKMWKQERYV
jgi:hypothetical protein